LTDTKETPLEDDARVLVVDDNADFAESVAELLEARGYVTRVARDGLEALAMLEDFDPDCMLLDLHMPNLNGADVAHQVRERGGRVVVVAVSGHAELHIQSEDLVSVDHWLTKPLDLNTFYKIFPVIAR
jgi:CheY-like chemotaxis protein